MRGRKKIPTPLKILKGTARKSRLNPDEPEYKNAGVLPTKLIKNDDYALEEWIMVAPTISAIGVLTNVDISTLERYCIFHSRWRTAEEKIRERGLITISVKGHEQANPYLSIATNAAKNANKLAAELGITPASRSKVSAGKSKKETKDPFADFG